MQWSHCHLVFAVEFTAPRHDRDAQPGAVHVEDMQRLHHGLLGSEVFNCPTCGVVMDCDVDESTITLVVKEEFPVFVPDGTASSPPPGRKGLLPVQNLWFCVVLSGHCFNRLTQFNLVEAAGVVGHSNTLLAREDERERERETNKYDIS